MILKHIVMWTFKEEAEGLDKRANALLMKQRLEALVGIVPQLISAEVGVNVNSSDSAADAVLVSTFRSFEDLAAYKVHPAHV